MLESGMKSDEMEGKCEPQRADRLELARS